MTGLGRYQAGLDLEAKGMKASDIARKLGFKDAQAWYGHKYIYKKKQDALNSRAAEGGASTAPVKILDGVDVQHISIQARKEGAVISGFATDPKFVSEVNELIKEDPKLAEASQAASNEEEALKITVCISAEGKVARYRLAGTTLHIIPKNQKGHRALHLDISEWMQMETEVAMLLNRKAPTRRENE